jgi:quercetin dioxygenase-like cupin family protein
MRHFLHIAHSVDVLPLLLALYARPDLWNQVNLRTTFKDTPHKDADDILLRFNDLTPYAGGDASPIVDEHESINFPAFAALPQARPLIFDLMARVQGERLGRCMITRVPPGGRITPHADGGSHAAYYERYHIVLQSNPKSMFRCGADWVNMQAGDVWWFDNGIEHEVVNDGECDRIHLIVDIKASK